MHDVIVIGGGLAGLSAAYRAVREGATVAIVDRADEGRASAAGAGILTPGTTRNAHEAWWRAFAFPAVRHYDTLLAWLAEDGEAVTGHERTGLLHVAIDDKEMARLAAVEAMARSNLEFGAPLIDAVERITGAEAKALFPALADLPGALFVSGACRVDGRLLMAALRRAIVRRGATLLRESAMAIEIDAGRVTGVRFAGNRTISGSAVIVAAGAWSDALLDSIGVHVPVVPQRGQIAHMTFLDRETGGWPTLMGFHTHYMLAFPGGKVVAGATREADAGFAVETTAGGVHEVLGEALRLAPGLAEARLEEVRVGLRPTTPDGRPVIGATSVAGAYLVSGHGPSGLQLAPFSGDVVARLALGGESGVDLSPFDPGRFQQTPSSTAPAVAVAVGGTR